MQKVEKRIGEKIKLLRVQAKMNQEEFAYKISISRSNISKWESGLVTPGIDILEIIAKEFKIDIKYFFDEDVNIEAFRKSDSKFLFNWDKVFYSGIRLKPKHSVFKWIIISLLALVGIILETVAFTVKADSETLRKNQLIEMSAGFGAFGIACVTFVWSLVHRSENHAVISSNATIEIFNDHLRLTNIAKGTSKDFKYSQIIKFQNEIENGTKTTKLFLDNNNYITIYGNDQLITSDLIIEGKKYEK